MNRVNQTIGIEPELQPVVAALDRFVASVMAQTMTTLLELNITFPQLRTLRVIERRGRTSGRQLAHVLQISPASVVPLCDRLEEQGYVERVRDTDDRRIWWLQLTPAGAGVLENRAAPIRSRSHPVLTALSPHDRENLAHIFDSLAAAIAADEQAAHPVEANEQR
ncbi:MAG: MarR family transcriptional regulator [Chloroflexi bacterium]|nr:MarR family transcriptional regulator [Chloroflexota bacterium]